MCCKSTLFFDKCKKYWYFCTIIKSKVMLQRIQTIWMLLAGLSSVALLFTLDVSGVKWLDTAFNVLVPMATVGSFFNIFRYKNRISQCYYNIVLVVINVLLIILLAYWLLKLSGGIDFPEKGIEPIFPVISIFCLLLANVFIKRDERLVKSVDRLR